MAAQLTTDKKNNVFKETFLHLQQIKQFIKILSHLQLSSVQNKNPSPLFHNIQNPRLIFCCAS